MQDLKNNNDSNSDTVKKKTSNPLLAWAIPIILALVFIISFEKLAHNYWKYESPLLVKMIVFIGLYFAINWIYNAIFVTPNTNQVKPEPHPGTNWPTSGPLKRFGNKIAIFTYLPSILLSAFNPFQFVQMMKQLFGQFKVSARIKDKEEEFANYRTKVKYRLPFNDEWLIYNGGHRPETSHSWSILAQRYAYDFVIADADFCRHTGNGMHLNDYYCYNQPIVAAADGEVVSLTNNIGPAPLVGFFFIDFFSRSFLGNHIIIKHADGEYGFYAHLVKGSIKLKPGDQIIKGQQIGCCGHTGHSTEPHLHFQLQDRANFYLAMGLPVIFEHITLNNNLLDEECYIERGSRVENTTN